SNRLKSSLLLLIFNHIRCLDQPKNCRIGSPGRIRRRRNPHFPYTTLFRTDHHCRTRQISKVPLSSQPKEQPKKQPGKQPPQKPANAQPIYSHTVIGATKKLPKRQA